MTKTGGGNLEERLRDARPRVLVVDDNPNDLALLLRFLNKLGEPDNLKFAGTSSPSEGLKLLTQDNSFWISVLDIRYNSPPTELGGFPDGTALAREVSKQNVNLDYLFMSGDPSLVHIIQNISSLQGGFGFTAWEKPSKFDEANVGVLYDSIKALIDKRARPKNPRIYILGGPSSSGKTTLIDELERIMPWVASCAPTTYRKQEQTRDKLEPDREFMGSFEKINEKIMRTDNPLVWALVDNPKTGSLDNFVFTNQADYLKAAGSLGFKSKCTAVSMVDLDAIAQHLAEGCNVMIPIRVHKVSEEIKNIFGGLAQIVSLYVNASERARRSFGRRRILEYTQRFLGDEEKRPGETVIDTEYPQVSGDLQDNMKFAIRHVVNKLARLIKASGDLPYDREIHSAYVEKVERALSGLGGTNSLKPRGRFRILPFYAADFQRLMLMQEAYTSDELSLVDTVSSLTITDVQIKAGVKTVSVVPYTMRTVDPEIRDREPWKAVLKDFISFCMKKVGGFEPAEAAPAQPGLVYTLTDGPPLLRGDNRLPYRLEVVPAE